MRSPGHQKGVALPMALMWMVLLSGALMVLLSLGSTESVISRSHAEGTESRYVAEAGIEFAFDALALNANWDAILLGPDGVANTADDGRLALDMPLPGQPAAQGTFTVTVRNDHQADDTKLTGAAPDPGGAFTDTNGRVIITSVGGLPGNLRTIQVVLTRINLPPLVAALALPGNESETTFNGNAFVVNGRDTNLDDTPGPEAARWGIAVANGNVANEAVVQNSLSGPQKDNVTGRKQTPSGPGYGDNTIAPDPQLSPGAMAEFVNAIKSRADITLTSTQSSPLSYTNIGASCASDVSSPTCWGTREYPKIVYIKGEADPTSAFAALRVSGNTTGTGILIVEDGDFRISGNFRWEGIVLVTGQYVGVGYMGGGWQTVYGAVISNETATDPGYKEALISGNAKLNYSSEALNLIRNSRRMLNLTSWREM
jgi:hypothetical protein